MTGETTLLYARTQGGRMIHRRDCKRAGRQAAPWRWADGKTVANILTELDAVGLEYRWCHYCFHNGEDLFDAMMENRGYERVSVTSDGLERWERVGGDE